jgi:hypothetical protein
MPAAETNACLLKVGSSLEKFCRLWETVAMGNKNAPKREVRKPKKKKT